MHSIRSGLHSGVWPVVFRRRGAGTALLTVGRARSRGADPPRAVDDPRQSPRTSFCASVTPSPPPGSSCPARGAASPSDGKERSRWGISRAPRRTLRSGPPAGFFPRRMGTAGSRASTSSFVHHEDVRRATVVVLGPTIRQWTRPSGATSPVRPGSSPGDYTVRVPRASVGGDRQDRGEPAEGNPLPASAGTSRRTAALPLRPTGCGTRRAERACSSGPSRTSRRISACSQQASIFLDGLAG